MKFAKVVREAILSKNETLGIAIDITRATEQGKSLKDIKKELKIENENSPDISPSEARFEFTDGARFQASYLDIFVEDAICFLSSRARQFYWSAAICIALAIAVLIAGIGFVIQGAQDIPSSMDITHLIMKIFSSLAIAGLVLVAAKGILSLIRAFLHEATRLLERRHALRFGKLFFYLKLGRKNDSIDLTLKDIQEAFQWNKETSTAFQDMRPEVIADTIINQMARMPSSIIVKTIEEYSAYKNREKDNQIKKTE
jgi:hypothetical protein